MDDVFVLVHIEAVGILGKVDYYNQTCRYRSGSDVSSVMPLTVERFWNDDVLPRLNASNTIDASKMQADIQGSVMPAEKPRKSLRNRPAINYSQFNYSSDEELSTDVSEHRVRPTLGKKGVIRGCPDCSNCQKVLARWCPEDACRPVIDEAPVFYPSEEEFKDTLKYIETIRAKAETYGVCRIVPPSSWKPPCPLKEKVVWENSRFSTRVQRVDLLQKRYSIKQKSKLNAFARKRRRLLITGSEHENKNNAENFGFEPGPYFTLESFQKYADDFKTEYFLIKNKPSDENMKVDHPQVHWEPSIEDIEGEYWRIVEKPTKEIEVLYGADLDSGYFGSGFPKATSTPSNDNKEDEYSNSGWNLNKFPRLTGSLIAFEGEDISGVSVPWLYIGMCFSSFCWHVEDHHLYSLNYMHWGAPKMWYAVPGKDALLLEAAMKKHLPDLFEEQPDLLHKLVTQFSPSMLRSEGVPVYRCVQHSGEFVITFPRAYHSGFNCGFNCAEAVNVAPVDWLPHGQSAVELYRDQGRKISISHDKLLLGAAREAVKAQWDILFLKKITSDSLIWKNNCGQDKILIKALKERMEMERARREHLGFSQSRKMDASFDASGDQECFICHYDLHLSAVSCPCSPDKFACLDHAKQMCTCDSGTRFLLFRYDVSELNVLIDALGGKLSAVHRWGLLDLGRSLRAYTQPKSQRQAIGRETLSEARKKKKPSEGTSSNLLSFSEQNYNQKGNHQVIVNGSDALQEKGMGCKEVQMMKRQITSGLGTNNTLQTNLVKESNCYRDSVSLGAVSYSGSDGNILSAGNLNLNAVQKEPLLAHEMKDLTRKRLELSARVEDCNYKVTACSQRDQVLQTCQSNAVAMDNHDVSLLKYKEKVGHLSSVLKVREEGKFETLSESAYISQDHPTSTSSLRNSPNIIITRTVSNLVPEVPASNKVNGDENLNNGNNSQNLPVHGATDASKGQKVEICSAAVESAKVELIRGNESCLTMATDRNNLLNDPRIAEVVRRMGFNVEVLDFGVILSGRLWSTSQVIFPKGYKSRVKYLNVLDPAQMCDYVSEILDGGEHGPLFMVHVEHCPSEVFIHISAIKCWNMVRERVNHEIRRLCILGKVGIPSLQLPGSIDGLEMFGLTSPTTIQAIEALDHKHISLEYWTSKPPNQKPPITNDGTRSMVKEEPKLHGASCNPGSDSILHQLIEKAKYEELQVLHQLLTSNRSISNQETIQILNKAIQRSSQSTVSECTNLSPKC